MSKVRKPASRLIGEIVLIVVSILLAFGIDAAWEERNEAREEQQLLTDLREEFEFQRSELARHMARWEAIKGATATLIEAAGATNALSPVVVDSLLNLFLTPPTFDPRKGTLSAASASGGLRLVRSHDLQARLAAWDGVVDEVRDNEVAGRDLIYSGIIPYLARNEVPAARAWALRTRVGLAGGQVYSQRWPGPLVSDGEAGQRYRLLLADPEFQVFLGARYVNINVDEYAEAIVFVDELLAMLENEIDSR